MSSLLDTILQGTKAEDDTTAKDDNTSTTTTTKMADNTNTVTNAQDELDGKALHFSNDFLTRFPPKKK